MTPIPLQVPAYEHGVLRLWGFDGASEAGRDLVAALRAEPREAGPTMAALGAERVDPYWLDLVALRDLGELGGLAGYLRQAYEVADAGLADLTVAGDHVLIVPSRAFADQEQTLAPASALKPLGALITPQDLGALRPMAPVATALPDPGPAQPPAPGQLAGRGLGTAVILLLLLMAAIVVLVAR